MDFITLDTPLAINREKQREKLVAAYFALSGDQLKVVDLLAVAAPESVNMTNLVKCLKDLGITDAQGKALRPLDIFEHILQKDLLKSQLILIEGTTSPQCHQLIMEVAARRLVRAGEFAAYAAIVRKHMPIKTHFGSSRHYQRRTEFIREVRIANYLNDMAFIEGELNTYNKSQWLAQDKLFFADLLFNILDNPFDPEWLLEVPVALAGDFLLQKIPHPFAIVAAADIRSVLYRIRERIGWPIEENRRCYFRASLLLIEQLIIRGEWREAEQLIGESNGLFPNTPGIMECEAWLLFLKGENEAALKLFSAGHQALKKVSHKKKIFFMRSGGIFYILALLKTQDPAKLKEANDLFELIWEDSIPFLVKSPLRYLLDTLQGLESQVKYAKELPPVDLFLANPLHNFIGSLCRFWVDEKAAKDILPLLISMHQLVKKAGLAWFAAELAELLARLGADSKKYAEEAAAFRFESGAESILNTVVVQSAWERSLAALLTLDGDEGVASKNKATSSARVVWFIEGKSNAFNIIPIEQKSQKNNRWSSGKNIALKRLYDGKGPDCLTDQDRLILTHLKSYKYSYYAVTHQFEPEALFALVGHPLVFRDDGSETRVEIVKGEPELIVRQGKNGKITLVMVPKIDKTMRVAIVEESPGRCRVIEVTPEHLRIAAILGEGGLSVPEKAKKQVVQAASAMARHMTVHSDIGVETAGATEMSADSRPHVLVRPAGLGLKITLCAKPLGTDGPTYPPGSGGATVIGVVNGGRVYANRDLAAEKEKQSAFLKGCSLLQEMDDSDGEWLIDDPETCLELLLELEQQGDNIVVAWPEGRKMKVVAPAGHDSFSLKIRSKNDWFGIDGTLNLDGERVLSLKQLLELASTTSSRFLAMGEGEFLALTSEFRRRLDDFRAFTQPHGTGMRIHPLAAQAITGFLSEAGSLDVDTKWRKQQDRLENTQGFAPALPTTLQVELREYQTEGFFWLARLAHLGMGACLADDMGLGKTVQALAVLLFRAKEGPALVVAPTSVCPNWQEEAKRFTPTINAIPFGAGNRQQVVENLRSFDLLVVSYGLLQTDEVANLLAGVAWSTVILDEAQAIKNFETKRSQAAMKLQAGFRLLTTGTPIENHLGELWNLFRFINPGLLGSLESFNERFAGPIERLGDQNARKRLRKLIQPFILRRLKSQVLEELPPRTDIILHVDLSTDEQVFYEAIRQKALETATSAEGPPGARHLKILAEIMRLRRACCHPKLVLPTTGITSSKLQVFGEVVDELLAGRHKVLVFSQFVGHLTIIREYLDEKTIRYQYLDGSTPARDRKKAVDAFQAGEGDIFLISLKAGGTGLNLTAADYVIHLDPWWNPAVEDQASDRAHRIGQERPVTVYRLVARQTIEEKIVALHHKKRDLADGLLSGSDIAARISTDDLIRLIRGEKDA